MYHCYFLINYIGPPKVFFLSFGPLFKKFAHHCSIQLAWWCVDEDISKSKPLLEHTCAYVHVKASITQVTEACLGHSYSQQHSW